MSGSVNTDLRGGGRLSKGLRRVDAIPARRVDVPAGIRNFRHSNLPYCASCGPPASSIAALIAFESGINKILYRRSNREILAILIDSRI
jgi:hypothetical protein